MQHRDAALDVNGVIDVVNDVPIGSLRVKVRQTLGHRLATHRHDVALEAARLQQVGQHHRNAANRVEVAHVIFPVGLGVSDVGNTLGDLVEVVEL